MGDPILLPLAALVLHTLSCAYGTTSMGAVVNMIPVNQQGETKVMAQYSVLAPLPCSSLGPAGDNKSNCTAHISPSPLQGLFPSPGWCLCQWQNIVPSNYTYTLNLGSVVNEVLPMWVRTSARSDTKAVNQPTQVALLPPLRLGADCSRRITLGVKDVDGDEMRCRFADTEPESCPDCAPQDFLQLSQEDCVLVYSGGGEHGQYSVRVMVEDFPKGSTDSSPNSPAAMSSTPLHLSLTVLGGSTDCEVMPMFAEETPPDGAKFTVLPYEQLNITVSARSDSEIVTEIAVVGPPGLWVSALKGDKKAGSLTSVNIAWTRTPNQLSQLLPICFTANTESSQSEARCVWIDQKPMDTLPSGTAVQCTQTHMNLTLPVASLVHLPLSDLQLNDPSCPIIHNETHVMAVVPLNECGTKIVHAGSELIYTNTLRTVRPLSTITRLPTLVLPMACRFPGSQVKSSPYNITLPSEQKTFGAVSFQIKFYRPGEGPLGNKAAQPVVSQRVAFPEVRSAFQADVLDLYIFANCTVVRTQLIVGRCVQSSTPGFEVTQPILDQGCVKSNGTAEVVSSDPKVKIYRLSLNSFNTGGNLMYVECTVHLCITTIPSQICPSPCSLLKQQMVVETVVTHNYTVRSDAIVLTNIPSASSNTTTDPQISTTAAVTTPGRSCASGKHSVVTLVTIVWLLKYFPHC